MQYRDELKAAREAARRANDVILRAYASFEAIANPRIDISTEADRAAQEVILQYLREEFPADALCAEEATPTLKAAPASAPRVWVVDPIDGTRGFATKNGEYSTMIALLDGDQVVLGLVLEPAKNRLTYAVRGQGCFREDTGGTATRCQVSRTASLASATLVQSHSKKLNEPSWPVRVLKPARVVETYSAGVKLALVARGEVDLYVNTYTEFHDWDIAAGQILVEEAGGTVTGLNGETLRYRTDGAWQRDGLLGTNGAIHAAAVNGLSTSPTR
jgi:3'(2'), 5'-bisphosphate nucleotidase